MDRRAASRYVMSHLVLDLSGKVLLKQGRETFKDCLVGAGSWKTKPRDGGRRSRNCLEDCTRARNEAAVRHIDEKTVGGKEVCPQYGAAYGSDPESMVERRPTAERNFQLTFTVRMDRGAIGSH